MQAQMQKLLDTIKERTKKPAYALTITPEKTVGIFDSKFGGVPYWDLQKPYPKDTDDKPMALLAQFNFDKDKVDEPLPTKGILQFFISPEDDIYGMDTSTIEQKNYRIVYHETIDTSVTEEQIKALDIPWNTEALEYFPVMREVGVSITPKEIFISTMDANFDKIFCEIASEVLQKDVHDVPYYDILSEDEEDEFFEELINGHSLLGYPHFTQFDPREDEKLAKYSMLLFQMDSDYEGAEDYVMWGDAGIANFFIKPEDLKNKKFDDVLYNWDCS